MYRLAQRILTNKVRRFMRPVPDTTDFIVVGAGTAGCVLANRLTASGKFTVALIEGGGYDTYPWIHVPVGYLYTMNNPRTDWCFSTVSQSFLGGRVIAYPRGRVLGGSSSINGMIYMRGQRADYDRWSEANPGWSWEDVRPHFDRSLDYHPERDAVFPIDRNKFPAGGEWRVENQRLSWEVLDTFAMAAESLGMPKLKDFNSSDSIGSGYFQVNQQSGIRLSASEAFLHPVANRANLFVVPSCTVQRIICSDRSVAEGVEILDSSGNSRTIRATKEVILSAGAIGSPHLLQVSGIGDRSLLEKHGVNTLKDVPGVGRNLQDHLQIRSVYKVRREAKTLNTLANSGLGKIALGLEYVLNQGGPLSMAPSQLGLFCKSSGAATPNMQYHVQPLSLDKFGEPLHPFPGFTAAVCNLRPSSRGTVTLSGPSIMQPPRIDPNYLSTEKDRSVAVEGLRLTRKIMAAEPMATKFEPVEFMPGLELQEDLDLADAAGQIGTSIFHPVGTCKMGPETDHLAVVDHQLKVHGVSRLRVVDASIMPTITSGNTNSPTVIMIGEKGAEHILNEYR